MKIGVYLDDYRPEDGGAHTFQAELIAALETLSKDSKHEFVLLVAGKPGSESNTKELQLDIAYFRKANIFELVIALIARNWPNCRNAIRWRDVSEKQFRKQGVQFVWFLSARPKEMDLPYMATVWDLQHRVQPWFPEVSEWGQWEIRERGYQRFIARAAAIIAGTQAGKDEITRFYRVPEDRVLILPHPTPSFSLDVEESKKSDVQKRFELPESYLFYPAQFWAHKNHIGILKALKILKEEHGIVMGAAFVGADYGNREFVMEKAEEWGIAKQIKLLGFVEIDDLINLYRSAFALSYMSAFGPENLPPLEAMALGCPVIAARVDGAEEQLGDAALLVDTFNPFELASAIATLKKDKKLRAQLIRRGKKRAAKWTAMNFVQGTFEIFDEFESVRELWGN
jgi:glycosyltransferase involved in cell wall biosynthesis